jgi:hypothetical protein
MKSVLENFKDTFHSVIQNAQIEEDVLNSLLTMTIVLPLLQNQYATNINKLNTGKDINTQSLSFIKGEKHAYIF